MRSGTVDIVFANESEVKSLYQTASFDAALEAIRKDCRIAAVTRSERGSVIVRGDETVGVKAIDIEKLVDTTGAGDLYAAGFLFGYTAGRSLGDCGKLGSLAAGLVIQQVGPRPRQSLQRGSRASRSVVAERTEAFCPPPCTIAIISRRSRPDAHGISSGLRPGLLR